MELKDLGRIQAIRHEVGRKCKPELTARDHSENRHKKPLRFRWLFWTLAIRFQHRLRQFAPGPSLALEQKTMRLGLAALGSGAGAIN